MLAHELASRQPNPTCRLALRTNIHLKSAPDALQPAGTGNALAELSHGRTINTRAASPDLGQADRATSNLTWAAQKLCLAVIPLLHTPRRAQYHGVFLMLDSAVVLPSQRCHSHSAC